MLIESKIRRSGGSLVTLGETNYRFKPADPADPDSPHVCEVTDPAHIQTLLNIPHGFRDTSPTAAPELFPEPPPPAPPLDPEAMTNKDLYDWATQRKIVWKSKQSIMDYGRKLKKAPVELDENLNAPQMLRELVKAELAANG